MEGLATCLRGVHHIVAILRRSWRSCGAAEGKIHPSIGVAVCLRRVRYVLAWGTPRSHCPEGIALGYLC
ncbi:hypothetical protein MLD38_024424 [Melastoma candidum]|uniref:Uncharacterized protein n=1 Tax=Melastoma candidum TaxID=119954 RepID=A0ACB9NUX4_9MYRT|nr:hypothetical protein MLD38_024424 [Melastoma candidum]